MTAPTTPLTGGAYVRDPKTGRLQREADAAPETPAAPEATKGGK